MRSLWKGHLRFHMVAIPISLYKAEESASEIHFNQLHELDNGRIGYVKRCKKCGREVSNDDIVKGFEVEKDQYVVIDPQDLENVRVKSTKVIEIEGFVDRDEVHPTLYDEPYYAGPDGAVAEKTYALLREALSKSGKLAVGRVVLHNRERFVAIAPHGNGIVMYRLRLPQEMRSIDEVPSVGEGAKVGKGELDLAKQLIDTMTVNFSDLDFKDRYQEAVRGMIEAKVKGQEFVTPEEDAPKPMDVFDALKASIDLAAANRPPVKKAAPRKPSARRAAAKKKK